MLNARQAQLNEVPELIESFLKFITKVRGVAKQAHLTVFQVLRYCMDLVFADRSVASATFQWCMSALSLPEVQKRRVLRRSRLAVADRPRRQPCNLDVCAPREPGPHETRLMTALTDASQEAGAPMAAAVLDEQGRLLVHACLKVAVR